MNKQQQFEVCITSKETNDILYIDYNPNDFMLDIENVFKQLINCKNKSEIFIDTLIRNIYNLVYEIRYALWNGENIICYLVSEKFDNEFNNNDIVINICFDFKEYEDYLQAMNVYNIEYKAACEHFETKCLFKENIFSVDDILEAYNVIEGV